MVSENDPLLGNSAPSGRPDISADPFTKPDVTISAGSASPVRSSSLRLVFNSDPDAVLETAANDVYEALLDDSDYENEQNHDEDAMWLREQRTLNKSLHWFKRPSVGMVVFSIFVFSFSATIAEGSKQILYFKLACNYLAQYSPTQTCDPVQNQVLVSNLELGLTTAGAVVTMAAATQIGLLADKYGRKPFIVLNACSMLVARFVRYAYVLKVPVLRYWLMIVVETSAMVFGGPIIIMTLANCYVSDVVEAHERIFYLGFGIAAFFLGLSSGPFVGNFLLSFSDKFNDIPRTLEAGDSPNIPDKVLQLVAYIVNLVLTMVEHIFKVILGDGAGEKAATVASEVAADSSIAPKVLITSKDLIPLRAEIIILAAFVLFAIFVLPELRLAQARRKSSSLSRSLSISLARVQIEKPSVASWLASCLNSLSPLRILTLPDDVVLPSRKAHAKKDRRVVMTLVALECLITGMAMSTLPVLILYGVYMFQWEAHDLSVLIGISCMARATVLLVLLPIINHRVLQKVFGMKTLTDRMDRVEHSMALLGMVMEVIGLVFLAACTTSTAFVGAAALTAFSSLIGPSLNSAVIKYYPELMIGEVFGATAVLKNTINLIGPFVFLTTYKKSITLWDFPTLVIYVLAGIMAICVAVMLWIGGYADEKKPQDAEQIRDLSYSELHRSNSFVYQQRQR